MIPVNEPLFNGNEKKYLNECIDSGWISSEGPFVNRFEEEMACYVGRKYATACSSGTAALELAVVALDLQKGDEVIMPTFTIISCAQALVNRGVTPVFVDCDIHSFNMKAEDVESRITSRTKAIMIVHIYGLTVDIDPIIELAKKNKLKIIEDAAQVLGQNYKGKKCGSFGDISVFSFYPNKLVTTGEGGMVLVNDSELDERAKSYRNLCFSSERFIHEDIGFNYRMTNIQAAIGVAQLENIDNIVKKKRWIGSIYNELFNKSEGIETPLLSTPYCNNIYWVYSIVLNTNTKSAKEVINTLLNNNIGARPFFYPMHLQPVFKKMNLSTDINLKNSETLYKNGLYIPSGLALTEEQIVKSAKAVIKVI